MYKLHEYSVSVKKEEKKRFSKNPPKHEVSKTNCDKIKINKQNRGRYVTSYCYIFFKCIHHVHR